MKSTKRIASSTALLTVITFVSVSAHSTQAVYPYTTRQEIGRLGKPSSAANKTHYAPSYETTQDLNHRLAVVDTPVDETSANKTENVPYADGKTQQVGLTEQEAIGILKTANEAEIDAAKIASKKATDTHVKEFAQRMVSEHKKNKTLSRQLLSRLGLSADSSQVSELLKEDSEQKNSELKKLSGAAFDQNYISSQIEMHRALLTDMDQRLIPAVSKPELKEFLRTTKDHVKHHLADAQEIQSGLKKTIE